VALIVLSLLWSKEAFAFVMFFAMLVSLLEFYAISKKIFVSPQIILGVIWAITLFSFLYAIFPSLTLSPIERAFLTFILFAPCMFFVELFRKKEKPFVNLGFTLLGIVYISLPFGLTNYIYQIAGAHFLLCFFTMLWANDSFAYVFGSLFGKHKLLSRISPKKTWEGYIGGMLSVGAFSYALHCYFCDIAWQHLFAMGLIISVTATLGDLVESMFKRSADVKDSGRIMPGHGGLLDRFDGALLSLPFIFVYVQLFMNL
ncbi:MAG: phosphatidate cytidylyltransferase, partial [Bacteroidales bacterium]